MREALRALMSWGGGRGVVIASLSSLRSEERKGGTTGSPKMRRTLPGLKGAKREAKGRGEGMANRMLGERLLSVSVIRVNASLYLI